MHPSYHQQNMTAEPNFEVPQQTSAHCSSWIVRSLGWLCMVVALLYLGGFHFTADALAQCATCQTGGRCGMNHNGTCMANRTFWGYYQGNWRKWPTVAAAEEAAANAPPKQSPSSLAPNSVLPSPENEARSTTPNISSPRTNAENQEATTAPNENPIQDTPKPNLPSAADPLGPKTPQADPAKDLFPNTKLPGVKDPMAEPKPMPNPDSVRPALPGSLLDDPAPSPPVDPNDRVPNLPPNLKDLETDEPAPNLDDLFKSDGMDKPKPPGGASIPRGNQPAAIQQAAVTNEAENSKVQRHGRFAKDALGLKPAAANTPSAAGLALDEMDALERTNGPRAEVASRGASSASVQADSAEAVPIKKNQTIEVDEPELLLSPEDTTEAKNPLRDEMIRARYAARMFTPQTKASAESSDLTQANRSMGGSKVELNSANPLRSDSPRSSRSIQNVVPVSYEEPVKEEPTSPVSKLKSESAKQDNAVRQAIPVEPTKASEESVDSEVSAFQQPVSAEPMLALPAKELRRENSSASAPMQRKQQGKAKSDNGLRAKPSWDRSKDQSNPLRAVQEAPPTAQEGKTLATGRYAASVTPGGSIMPKVAPAEERGSEPASAPEQETFAPPQKNPLRSQF